MDIDRRRVLVTGGTGMIGMNLASRLAHRNKLFYVCRPFGDRDRLNRLKATGEVLTGDITDPATVAAALGEAKPDIVFHLASTAFNGPAAAKDHFDVIVGGTFHLLEALRSFPGTRFVFTGSTAEYGSGSNIREDHPLQPATLLGAAKANASILVQAYARLYKLPTVVLRLFMPYGPWEKSSRLIPQTILSALNGKDVAMTAGAQERDFVYVDDVVDALVLAATRDLPTGALFNVGYGTGVPIRNVVDRIIEIMGNPIKPLYGAIPSRLDEIMEMSADISLAARELGWQPKTTLDEGLRKSIMWFTEHRN